MKIYNRYTQEVIFEGYGDTKEVLRAALAAKVNLSESNLSWSNLSESNLSESNLSRSNLSGSDLSWSNLSESNLSRSDLGGSNLSGSNLSGSNLSRARLNGTIGNGKEIKSLQTNLWPIAYTKDRMQIGCQNHDIIVWWEFTDKQIADMDKRALEWWKVWKPILQKIIAVSPAV